MRPFVVLGNPENRRVIGFQEALVGLGHPPAEIVAWRALLADPGALDRLPDVPTLFRIDSFGEDFEVERMLLARGVEDAEDAGVTTIGPTELARLVEDRGRVLAPRQHHLGLLRALADVGRIVAAHPRWTALNPVDDVVTLFDKRETSRLYAAHGVPVPPSLGEVKTPDGLRAVLAASGAGEAYVKLSCGSSASCLALFEAPRPTAPAGRLTTTLEKTKDALYNSLRIRRYAAPRDVDALLAFLLREGSQVELAVPKARLDGAWFDCRVLVVAKEPAFTVVRTSPHPITNLHLGGRRGELARFEALVPAGAREAAFESCRTIGRLHGALHVGVDLLFERDLQGHRVVEANAFGDLLPGLTRDGLSVYAWEIQAALTR